MATSAKTAFVPVAERIQQEKQSALDKLASDEFLKAVHEELYDSFHPRRGGFIEHVRFGVPHLDESMRPEVQRIFDVMKQEYPQLNHFRIRDEGIIFDTRPNTAWRRFTVGAGHAPVGGL